MRFLAVCALASVVLAQDKVSDEAAKEAVAKFQEAFKSPSVEAKQGAVFDLHDVPHDLVLKELEKVLRNKDPNVRQVAALAVGGQRHDPTKAGDLLLRTYRKDDSSENVVASCFQAMAALKYMGYWPDLEKALRDMRTSIVVHSLELVGANKDWRAFPELVEMYKMAVPAGKSWSGGEEVTVDTGAEGDADQQAAEAQYKAQNPGRGGGGGGGPSRSSVLRNLSRPIGKCVKEVTGKSFETSLELSEWWVENYIMVAQKIAELEGKNPESVVPRAKIEQAELREKVAKEREEVEERLAKEAEKEKK